jgi:hypothetical protein
MIMRVGLSRHAQFAEFIAVLQESNSATVLATGLTAPMPTSGVANVVQRVPGSSLLS